MKSRLINQELIESISENPSYEKFHNIPAIYYKSWLEKNNIFLKDKKILDFGCGLGISTVGLSFFCDASEVIGVDIGDDYKQCNTILKGMNQKIKIPKNVSFKKIEPCESLGTKLFDVAVSWSVLEHVSQDIFDNQISIISKSIVDDGHAIFQIAPLYYSAFGSHLFGIHEPWAHLYLQDDILEKKVKNFSHNNFKNHWDCYRTLNKFSKDNFIEKIQKNGFKVIDQYLTTEDLIPPKDLLGKFNSELLTNNQILLVCAKA